MQELWTCACRCTGGGGGGDQVFFFNDTAPTEIYTLSLHDALTISNSHSASQFIIDRIALNNAIWYPPPLITFTTRNDSWVESVWLCVMNNSC